MDNLTHSPAVRVEIDQPTRNLAALLAATQWPQQEQLLEVHGITPQAQSLLRYVNNFRKHPAVRYLQSRLDAKVPMSQLFEVVVFGQTADTESAALVQHLANFSNAAELNGFWLEQNEAWEQARRAVEVHLQGADLSGFLAQFLGGQVHYYRLLPNLLFPSLNVVAFGNQQVVCCVFPPRKAVGESPPWPLSDDREYVLKIAAFHFALHGLQQFYVRFPSLMANLNNPGVAGNLPEAFRAGYATWPRQLSALLAMGITALFLNQVEPGAGDAYVLFERRSQNLPQLPQVVRLLEGYLALYDQGVHRDLSGYLGYLIQQL